MRIILFSFLIFGLIACEQKQQEQAQFVCEDIDKNYFGARYVIHPQGREHEEHDDQSHDKGDGDRYMTLWRIGPKVAHEYEGLGLTFRYSNARGDRLFKMQYFDEHERAIEFEPEMLSEENKDIVWQQKWQVLPDRLLTELELSDTSGENCNQIEQYVGHLSGEGRANTEYYVAWLTEFDLPFIYEAKDDKYNKGVRWQLAEIISNQSEIEAAFAKRDTFNSTDFADIGDNESDPFLMNMINLGFIEHGNSGFYDSEGNDIGGGHGH